MQMYEVYTISDRVPWKILDFGFWNEENGLVLSNANKWVRRNNLEVTSDEVFIVVDFNDD